MKTRSQWAYRYEESTERAMWSGSGFSGLRQHFHEEAQICHVTSGQRTFLIFDSPITVYQGEVLFIPAGVLHTAVPEKASFTCGNIYMSDVLKRQFDQCALLAKGAPFLKGAPRHEILDFCHNHGRTFMEHKFAMVPKLEFAKDGFTMASDAGWSREHFSRQFKLQYGLAPKKAELAARVNAARAMLRIGEHPANVAYDLGYADQSHLTRHFQYFFGIAPGAYIRGLKFKA